MLDYCEGTAVASDNGHRAIRRRRELASKDGPSLRNSAFSNGRRLTFNQFEQNNAQ
jgi:hypothetical protein